MPTPNTAPMEIDFDVCQNPGCESFDFSETTGVYSLSNSGGWGTPNFAISDAFDAKIIVTLPDGTMCPSISLHPTFPDDTGTATWTVSNSTLGLTGSLPDGIYIIEYRVDILDGLGNTQTFNPKKQFLFTCTIKCCVDKLIAKIPTLDCSCDDKNVKNAMLAFSLYQALINAGKCGNYTEVANLLARLTKICNSRNCGCN